MAEGEAWRRRRDEEIRAAEPEPWFIRQAREGRAAAAAEPPARSASDSPPPSLDDDLPPDPVLTRNPDLSWLKPPEGTAPGTGRRWWPALTGVLVVVALGSGWLLRGLGEPVPTPMVADTAPVGVPAPVPPAALASAQALCARAETLQGLAAVIFGQARRSGVPNVAWIERASTASTVRVDDAYVKTLDATDSVTVCSGRLALLLPPAATGAPAPAPLTATVDYTVQPAVDARGRVYRIDGAAPIVRQLVALVPVDTADAVEVAAADPVEVAPAPAPAVVPSVQQARPTPEPRPLLAAAPAAPSPRADRPAASRQAERPLSRPIPEPRTLLSAVPSERSSRVERPLPSPRVERAARPEAPGVMTASIPDTRAAPTPPGACGGDLSPGEQAVCGSPALTALDGEMNELFFGVVRYGDERNVRKVQKSSEKFIARRERCDDEACIAKAYRNRIEDLADFGLPRVGDRDVAEARPRPAGVPRVGDTSTLPQCKGFQSYRPSTPCRTVQNRRGKAQGVERET